MIVIAVFVLVFQAMTLAGVLTLMEEKNRKAGEKHKKHVYRKMSEPEARRILWDLANEMMITAEETAAIDTALDAEWNSKALAERKTEWNDEDIYSVLASIKTECKQRESCEGCKFRDGTETCNCNIWGVPSVWTVETKGAAK